MKNNILSDLIAVKNALNTSGVSWVLIDGLVLGFAREKDIIEYDTDVDLAIFPISKIKQQELRKTLLSNGFKLKKRWDDFMYSKRKSKLNLWVYHKVGNYYESYPKTTPGLKFVEKAEWYDKIQYLNFLGSKYPFPSNIDDYLNCRYGKNWKMEKMNHSNWRMEKFGTLDQSVEGQKIWLTSRCGKDGDLWPKIMKMDETIKK